MGVRSILWVAVLTCLAMLSKEQVTVITTVVNIIVIIIVTRASQCLLFVWCTKWLWRRSFDQETGSPLLQRLPLLVFITIIATTTITIILTSTTINMRDHYPGKSALPDWVKLSAQRFVLLGFTGVALMLASRQESLLKTIIKLTLTLARLHIMGSTLPVFTRFDNPAAVSESPTKQLTKPNLVTINWWLQHCITINIFTSQVWLTGGDFTRFAISLATVPQCYNILQAPGNAASGISWLHLNGYINII